MTNPLEGEFWRIKKKIQLICNVVEKLENKMTGSGQAGAMGMSHYTMLQTWGDGIINLLFK